MQQDDLWSVRLPGLPIEDVEAVDGLRAVSDEGIALVPRRLTVMAASQRGAIEPPSSSGAPPDVGRVPGVCVAARAVGAGVSVGLSVGVTNTGGVATCVAVGLVVALGVAEEVGVAVAVRVGVSVGVGVGVGSPSANPSIEPMSQAAP